LKVLCTCGITQKDVQYCLMRMQMSSRACSASDIERCRRSRDYYRIHIRQNFIAHDDEQDEERLSEIVSKARKDAEWVVNKVNFCMPIIQHRAQMLWRLGYKVV
jgi:hypothetical protein